MTSLPILREIQKQSKEGPDLDHCETLLGDLQAELERHRSKGNDKDAMVKTLTGFQKAVRAVKRRSNDGDARRWGIILEKVDSAKSLADEDDGNPIVASPSGSGLPRSVSEYQSRLHKQNKELYKNPPVMPPEKVAVHATKCAPPTRDKHNRLVFLAGESKSIELLLKDFRPNQTPEEILRGGSFGGTYFRTISSAVTGETYVGKHALDDTVPNEWIQGLESKRMLTSPTYSAAVNKYGVKCGSSLGMWESSGWISDVDPYGWFQWYCRFYQGRRCSDDFRQVTRWLKIAGPRGRFKSQLCNKILAAGVSADDASISPVIRQTLFHWGLLIDDQVLESHRKSC